MPDGKFEDDELTFFKKLENYSENGTVLVPGPDGKMQRIELSRFVPHRRFIFDLDDDVEFFLSTRKEKGKEIEPKLRSIKRSSFNKNHPTRITIHGWNGDEANKVNTAIVKSYLKQGDYNCIVVDWSSHASKSVNMIFINVENSS